jgi:hypothetical protein
MEPLWSPVVATGGNHWQNAQGRKPQKQAKTVATGCHRLPEKFHGKQGVCRGLPPVAGGPLPAKEGVDSSVACRPERYFLLQSGHGHCSHPQPVHASRITQRLYRRSRARLRASSTSRSLAAYAAVPSFRSGSRTLGHLFLGVWDWGRCAGGRFVDEAEYAHAVDEDDCAAEPAAESE